MIAGAEASTSQYPDALIVAVRVGLLRSIYYKFNNLQNNLSVITLDHDLEWILQDAMQMQDQTGMGI